MGIWLRFLKSGTVVARFGGSANTDLSGTCWVFDRDSRVMKHRRTSQRITFLGALPKSMRETVTNPAARSKPFQFLYEDGEIRYPFVVHWRSVGKAAGGLCIDYLRSTWLDANYGVGKPVNLAEQYGAWKRIDQAAVDALLCWPSSYAAAALTVEVEGGWSNGEWLPRLRKTFHAPNLPDFSAVQTDTWPPQNSLDVEATPVWRFHRSLARSSTIAFEPFDSDEECLAAGLEPDRPYLKRVDGKAIMFPARLAAHETSDGKSVAAPYYRYASEDFLLEFNGTLLPSFWEFETAPLNQISVRPSSRGDANKTLVPSLPLWDCLSTALIEGWLVWEGSDHRLRGDPQDAETAKISVSLRRRSSVIIRGGYIGGRFMPELTLKSWITG